MQKKIFVIGASNVDIVATPINKLTCEDSNIGTVRIECGGVGRNIAENLSKLDIDTNLVSVFGSDLFATYLKNHLTTCDIKTSFSLTIDNCNSNIYSCINQNDGDMFVAVNDMKLCDLLTNEHIDNCLKSINSSDGLIFDTNIPIETIEYITDNVTVPIFVDSVSNTKVLKLTNFLSRITGIKLNRAEACALTNENITCNKDLRCAAMKLHNHGVKYVFITLGKEGAYASIKEKAFFANSFENNIVSTTGCGDAFTAISSFFLINGYKIEDALAYGIAGAKICIQSSKAVAPTICKELLESHFKTITIQEEQY